MKKIILIIMALATVARAGIQYIDQSTLTTNTTTSSAQISIDETCTNKNYTAVNTTNVVHGDLPVVSFAKVNTNFNFVESQITSNSAQIIQITTSVNMLVTNVNYQGLTNLNAHAYDVITNAILNSGRSPAFLTNWFRLASLAITSNILPGYFTNFSGMEFTTIIGIPNWQYSTNSGTNWVNLDAKKPRLGVIKIRLYRDNSQDASADAAGIPVYAPIVTNLTVYSMTRPDLYGTTNYVYSQFLYCDDPVDGSDPHQVATKGYVDRAVANSSVFWVGGLFLNDAALNFDNSWQWTTVNGTNMNATGLNYLGVDILTFTAPILYFVTTNIGINVPGDGNVYLTVPTNGITSSPTAQFCTDLGHPAWQLVPSVTNSYPTVVAGAFTLTFPMPADPNCFIRVSFGAQTPSVATLGAVLCLSARTITNATDTTWGSGAGLICGDTNYLYYSVATNNWKRAALTSW